MDKFITIRDVVATVFVGLFLWMLYTTYVDHQMVTGIVNFLQHIQGA